MIFINNLTFISKPFYYPSCSNYSIFYFSVFLIYKITIKFLSHLLVFIKDKVQRVKYIFFELIEGNTVNIFNCDICRSYKLMFCVKLYYCIRYGV